MREFGEDLCGTRQKSAAIPEVGGPGDGTHLEALHQSSLRARAAAHEFRLGLEIRYAVVLDDHRRWLGVVCDVRPLELVLDLAHALQLFKPVEDLRLLTPDLCVSAWQGRDDLSATQRDSVSPRPLVRHRRALPSASELEQQGRTAS